MKEKDIKEMWSKNEEDEQTKNKKRRKTKLWQINLDYIKVERHTVIKSFLRRQKKKVKTKMDTEYELTN